MRTSHAPATVRRRRRRGRHPAALVAAVTAVLLTALVAACTGPSATGPVPAAGAAADDTATLDRVAVVTHGGPGDAFWSVVQRGAEQAGEDLGIAVDYTSSGDPTAQARLVDNAVAQGVDGLVVSMANPDALQDAVRRAVRAGIPVVTINAGAPQSAEYGAIGHVGQDERDAGFAAGQRFAEQGAQHLLCIVHEAGNIGLTQRCNGAEEAMSAAGGRTTRLQVALDSPADVVARIRGALQADPSVDAVLALNAQVATLAAQAQQAAGKDATIGTFDLNADAVAAIRSGDVAFAVDQQQYQQGYLPVVMLRLWYLNGGTLGGGAPVATGPAFVDAENVDEVAEYARQGIR